MSAISLRINRQIDPNASMRPAANSQNPNVAATSVEAASDDSAIAQRPSSPAQNRTPGELDARHGAAEPRPSRGSKGFGGNVAPLLALIGAMKAAGHHAFSKLQNFSASLAKWRKAIANKLMQWKDGLLGANSISPERPKGSPQSTSAALGHNDFSHHCSQGSLTRESAEPRLPKLPTEGLQNPHAPSTRLMAPVSHASLSQLPDELTVMLAAQLSLEDAVYLRHASSHFLRLSSDAQVLRDHYERAGLRLPADLTAPDTSDAAWEKLGQVVTLRRQYAVGPTSVKILAGHANKVSSEVFSPDSRFLVTASYDNTARVWDLGTQPPGAIALEGHGDIVLGANFSPDGRFIVTASIDGTARVWDWKQEQSRATLLEGHTDWLRSASFSPDGRFVVTASHDGTARIWDNEQETPRPVTLAGHGGWVRFATFSPDGRFVLTGADDGTARIWDPMQERQQAIVLAGHRSAVLSASFSSDGRFVVTTSGDGTARIWERKHEPLQSVILEGHTGPVISACFSPDGRFILTASRDGTARLWDMQQEMPQAMLLEQHTDWVTSAIFSPVGRIIVTTSKDGTVCLWDLEQKSLSAVVLEGGKCANPSATFSPDGRFLAITSSDGTIRLFDYAPRTRSSAT